MRVVHVNTTQTQGGAARAMQRLHKGLLLEGVDSNLLVHLQQEACERTTAPNTFFAKARTVLDEKWLAKKYPDTNGTLFSPSVVGFSPVLKQLEELKPDIVHLHWVAGGMMPLSTIGEIPFPVVWTLHDNWAFTGGCHVKWDCQSFVFGCGNCPVLRSQKSNDYSRVHFQKKQLSVAASQLQAIVSPSRWLMEQSMKSPITKHIPHQVIPNSLDESVFKPINSTVDLPKNKRIILFGALDMNDPNKGSEWMRQLIQANGDESMHFVSIGGKDKRTSEKHTELGKITNSEELVAVYNAARVFVSTSRQETFSNMILESLFCGTPVLAFNSSGNTDQVTHKTNGYLSAFNHNDLARGLNWVLDNLGDSRESIAAAAREKWSSKESVAKYISLYRSIQL